MSTTTTSNTNEQDEMLSGLELPSFAIMGKAGAGKTTAAEYLVQNHGFTRLSFAALLKEVAQRIWGSTAVSDRDKLQRLGVAVRDIDGNAWVNGLLRQLTDGSTPRRYVIDDLRFPNEYWALKGLGFTMIRVLADEDVRVDRLMKNGKFQDREQLNHISETALDEYEEDCLLANNGDPEFFVQAVGAVLVREEARV